MQIIVKKANITRLQCDAIVNPANSTGYMGGGAAGAIRRAGGNEIENAAVKQAPIPIGHAVVTTAGLLPCNAVIHAPTMNRPAERTNERNVRAAVKSALKCADKEGFNSIAFPGMGTGVGMVPENLSAKVMVETIKKSQFKRIKTVYLLAIGNSMLKAFQTAAAGKK